MSEVKRITFYIMKSTNNYTLQTDLKYKLRAKGIGEIILNLVKYYSFCEPTDVDKYEAKMLVDREYEGSVTPHNKLGHRLKVNWSEVDIDLLVKLTEEWQVDSISKVANFLLVKACALDYAEYSIMLQKLESVGNNYNSWVYVPQIIVDDIDIINKLNVLVSDKVDVQQQQLLDLGMKKSTRDSAKKKTEKAMFIKLLNLGIETAYAQYNE